MLGKRKRPHTSVVGLAVDAAEAAASLLPHRSLISPPSTSSSLQRLGSSPSSAHGSAVYPLSEANLARFNRSNSRYKARPLKGLMPRSPVRSRPSSPSKDNVRQQLLRLRDHGILDVERGLADAPAALRDLAQSISTRRDPDVPPSARKERILDVSAAAGLKKESDGLDALKKQLFLDPVISHGDDMLIDVAVDSNYVRGFMPPALGSTVSGDVKELETPRPDIIYGYIFSDIAGKLRRHTAPAPFTEEEETAYRIKKVQVSTEVMLPFLTAQAKSAAQGKNISEDEVQCLRDGAATVRANLELLSLVGVRPDCVPELGYHFSAACDLDRVRLYMHYRALRNGKVAYVTKRIYEGDLQDEEQVAGWRTRMRGIYDFAVGPRLDACKVVVAKLVAAHGIGLGMDDAATATTSSVPPTEASTSAPESVALVSVRSIASRVSFQADRAGGISVSEGQNNMFTPPRSEEGARERDESRKRRRLGDDPP